MVPLPLLVYSQAPTHPLRASNDSFRVGVEVDRAFIVRGMSMRAGAGNIIWSVVSSNFRRYLPVRHLLPSACWIRRAALRTPGKCLYMDKSKIGAGMH